jgi:type II secretory pathway component PulC
MGRLIDADDLIEYIKIWEIGNSISSDQKEFIDCVNRQFTVFDVDKVIERLETKKTKATESKRKYISEYFKAFAPLKYNRAV